MRVLIIFVWINLFAFNNEIELFDNLFTKMFNKTQIKVYTKKYKILDDRLKIVDSCKKADVILGDVKCKDKKPVFVLDYYNFKNNKNAIGGFYWRKGRPQLVLRKDKLKKYKLFISKEFEDYLE